MNFSKKRFSTFVSDTRHVFKLTRVIQQSAVVINFEVEADHLECLVDQGFLVADEATDRAKVAEAVGLVLFGLSEGYLEMDWGRYA